MIDIEYLQYSLSLARRSPKYASIFFLKAVNYCYILHVAQLRIRETVPDHRHIAIGWGETREVRVKGSYHTSAIVPSLGLANRSESFRPLVHLFAPLFSSSGPLPLSLPPPPFHTLDLCFLFVRLWEALGLWLHVVRLRSLSLFPRSSSSLLSSSFVFLFLSLAVSSFSHRIAIIVINDEEANATAQFTLYRGSLITDLNVFS